MKELLYKEFKLVSHPTTFMFLALSAMILIPNYPYYISFFYTTLGLYFTFLSARENSDIFYTMTLPVRKTDIVKASMAFVIIIELLQVILAVPFAIIRTTYSLPENAVGIEANVAFFGLSLIMLGLFNYIFFSIYYKNPDKVGKAFGVSSIIVFVYIIIAETLINAVPIAKKYLDTLDPEYLSMKLVILLIGIAIYVALNLLVYKKSIKNFEVLDL